MPRQIRISIVGTGLVGKQHIGALLSATNATLAAIVEPSPEGTTLAQKYGVPHFATLPELLDAKLSDGVILATPTPLHVAQGLACVRAGCAVLVEKPLGVSALESEELIHAAAQSGVPLLVGHHRRYNPIIQRAIELIRNGAIGDIRSLQATCWLYKPNDYFETAPWRAEKGAGPISVNLAHDVDLVRYLCGDVDSVQAFASPSRRGHANEDVAAATLRFKNGAVGTITVSDAIASPWSWELTAGENPVYPKTNQSCYQLGGSKGALSLPDLTLWTHKAPQSWWSPIDSAIQTATRAAPLVNQIEHFADVIATGAAPIVSGEEGLKSLRVLEAIQKACETEQTVHL